MVLTLLQSANRRIFCFSCHEQKVIQGGADFSTFTSELQVDLEPEIGSHIMNPSYIDADDSILGSDTWGEQSSMETRFPNMQSILAHSRPIGLPDVVSEQGTVTADEDFLEIKDLNDPMMSYHLDDITNRNLAFDTDEFYDSCDHFDSDMYLMEAMGVPIDPKYPHLHLDAYSNDESQNHAMHISQLWSLEETYNFTNVANRNDVLSTSPVAGFANASILTGTSKMHVMEQISPAESPSQSWFNSALSGFLDSIPSSPTFECVSSFRAAQINPQRRVAVSGGHRNTDRGYLFISILVGVGAVFWVLTIGAAFKVMKGLWGRFLSS